MGTSDICWINYSIHLKLKIFPLFWSHTWKYSIQGNKRLTKVKEKWSTIQFDIFYFSFISNIPISQTISVISRSDTWYFLHASNYIAQIKWIRLHSLFGILSDRVTEQWQRTPEHWQRTPEHWQRTSEHLKALWSRYLLPYLDYLDWFVQMYLFRLWFALHSVKWLQVTWAKLVKVTVITGAPDSFINMIYTWLTYLSIYSFIIYIQFINLVIYHLLNLLLIFIN